MRMYALSRLGVKMIGEYRKRKKDSYPFRS